MHAEYCARKNYGYVVQIIDDENMVVDEYSAGDSDTDSQVYCTGKLEWKILMRYARQAAREMLEEHGSPNGKIILNWDLISTNRGM